MWNLLRQRCAYNRIYIARAIDQTGAALREHVRGEAIAIAIVATGSLILGLSLWDVLLVPVIGTIAVMFLVFTFYVIVAPGEIYWEQKAKLDSLQAPPYDYYLSETQREQLLSVLKTYRSDYTFDPPLLAYWSAPEMPPPDMSVLNCVAELWRVFRSAGYEPTIRPYNSGDCQFWKGLILESATLPQHAVLKCALRTARIPFKEEPKEYGFHEIIRASSPELAYPVIFVGPKQDPEV